MPGGRVVLFEDIFETK